MTRPSLPRSALVLAAAVLALAAAAAPARADGFLVPTRPDRPVVGEWAVSHHRVAVQVRGQQARVTVDEEFVNLAGTTLEAEYVFPLPHGSMVSSITLFEGGRGLEGRLLRAEEARRAYEEIVRRQKDPALLEYLGRDLFRVKVFPIPPGQRRRVVLQYDQLLASDAGTVELVYPLNTEKFSARPLEEVVVTVDLEADAPLGPVYSPSHEVAVARPSARRAQVSFEARQVRPDTDFLLYWSTTRSAVGASLLTYWPHGEDRGYFLFLASPAIPDGEARAARPKEITLVVDTSGSMAGEKIEQVRSALRQVIGGLNAGDRFNVVAYHTAVVPLWDAPRPVTDESRAAALEFVAGMKAQGGTNIADALAAALAPRTGDGEMAKVILFLTDGRPTVGTTDPDEIARKVTAANAGGQVRIFAFGVGVDVNSILLDRLAVENHGAPTYVRPQEDVEPKVASLYEKVRFPVLTDLRFRMAGGRATEVLPTTVPDLFRGGQVVLAGRYDRGGPAEVVLTGSDGAVLREYHYALAAAPRGAGLASDFPARVWATRRIAQLIDEIRLRKRAEPELVEEIVRLSTRFGILTEYTAFLADERVELASLEANRERAQREVDAQAGKDVGGSAWSQGANQFGRRGAERPAPGQTLWFADEDDRGVHAREIAGVRQVANRAFFRKTAGWVDANVRDPAQVDETVTRWSPRFFEILRTTTPEENARLAQAGPLVLEVQGRVLRVLDEG